MLVLPNVANTNGVNIIPKDDNYNLIELYRITKEIDALSLSFKPMVTHGNPSHISFSLYNKTTGAHIQGRTDYDITSTITRSWTNLLSETHFNTNETIQLIVYAGLGGKTNNVGLRLENIMINEYAQLSDIYLPAQSSLSVTQQNFYPPSGNYKELKSI